MKGSINCLLLEKRKKLYKGIMFLFCVLGLVVGITCRTQDEEKIKEIA